MSTFKASIKDHKRIVKVRLSSEEQLNRDELYYFQSKPTPGFLKPALKTFLGKEYLEYTGPISISLEESLRHPLTSYEFFLLIEQIVVLVRTAAANGLCLDKIVFDLSHIYINETTRETLFIYIPVVKAGAGVNLQSFLETVIYASKPDTREDTSFISLFFNHFRAMRTFDPDKVEAYIRDVEPRAVNAMMHSAARSGFITDKPRDYYKHYGSADESTSLLDERTGLLDEEGTSLLNQGWDC